MTILSASGVPYVNMAPAPSAELERTLTATLAGMDPLLGVKWLPSVVWNARLQRMEGRYALTCRWPSLDSRWQMVQAGEIGETDAFDAIGWLCEDMQDPQSVPTSTDGIQDRVLALLGSMDNLRYPWKSRMIGTIEKNRQRHVAMKNEALDMTHDEASYRYRQVKGVPQSVGADFNSEGKLVP